MTIYTTIPINPKVDGEEVYERCEYSCGKFTLLLFCNYFSGLVTSVHKIYNKEYPSIHPFIDFVYFKHITSVNELSHLPEIIFHQTSGGKSWRAKPQAAGAQSALIPCANTMMWNHIRVWLWKGKNIPTQIDTEKNDWLLCPLITHTVGSRLKQRKLHASLHISECVHTHTGWLTWLSNSAHQSGAPLICISIINDMSWVTHTCLFKGRKGVVRGSRMSPCVLHGGRSGELPDDPCQGWYSTTWHIRKGDPTQYLDRCSCYKQWHRPPKLSQHVRRRFLCFADPAESDGCRSRLHRGKKY